VCGRAAKNWSTPDFEQISEEFRSVAISSETFFLRVYVCSCSLSLSLTHSHTHTHTCPEQREVGRRSAMLRGTVWSLTCHPLFEGKGSEGRRERRGEREGEKRREEEPIAEEEKTLEVFSDECDEKERLLLLMCICCFPPFVCLFYVSFSVALFAFSLSLSFLCFFSLSLYVCCLQRERGRECVQFDSSLATAELDCVLFSLPLTALH